MGKTPFFLRSEYSIRIVGANNDDGREFHCYSPQNGQTTVSINPFESFTQSAEKVFSLLQDMCVSSANLEISIKATLTENGYESHEGSYRLTTKEVEGNIGTVFVVEDKHGNNDTSNISVITCLKVATEGIFEQFADLHQRPEGRFLEILVESCGTGVRPKF